MNDVWRSGIVNVLFVVFQISVRVTTMDAELEFAIQPNTTGKQLFDQVRCPDHLQTLSTETSLHFGVGSCMIRLFCLQRSPCSDSLPHTIYQDATDYERECYASFSLVSDYINFQNSVEISIEGGGSSRSSNAQRNKFFSMGGILRSLLHAQGEVADFAVSLFQGTLPLLGRSVGLPQQGQTSKMVLHSHTFPPSRRMCKPRGECIQGLWAY